MLPLVAYYLVSTQGQGRLRLGLGAQRKAVAAFAEANSFAIVGEFTETEIGRPAPRTSRAALWQAKRAADRLRRESLAKLGWIGCSQGSTKLGAAWLPEDGS